LARRIEKAIARLETVAPERAAGERKLSPALLLLDDVRQRCPPRLVAHHDRVGAMAAQLARRLGIAEPAALKIGRSGTSHDIGMALVPPEIFDNPGRLSLNEKAVIHRHCRWGHDILAMAGDSDLALAALVALQHHERWDGSGYPQGLVGEETCLAARIVAICAVYDALRHPRPGKAALCHARAIEVVCAGDCESRSTAFDPSVREVFVRFEDDFRRIADAAA
jgi:putative two-component system response regulator